MRQALFTITCTTCHVRLAVRSEAAVGAILECPKCGCMVPVIPPEGWQPPRPASPAVQSSSEGTSTPSVSESESIAASVAGGDLSLDAVSAKGMFFRLSHSWYFAAVAPVVAAAIGIVVWLTVFSREKLDNAAAPRVEQSVDTSAYASVGRDQSDVNTPAPEQSAANEKNESTTVTASNHNDKSDTKPAEENSADAKPQPTAESIETKSAEVVSPRQKTPEVNAPEVKASADEKTPTTEAEQAQSKESVPAVIGTCRLIKLVAPEAIDVQSRLGDVIPGIEFRAMPFARAIALAAAFSGLPITIDPEAMARLEVSPRDPITLRLTNVTAEELLQEIVAKRGMAFVADEGQILVTDPAEQHEKLRRVRYTVSDLTGNDKSAADHLAALMQKLVAAESWQAAGGEGTIETDKTALVVTQTGAVQDQILVFCEKLRNARGRPLKSNRDPKRFDLSTRLQQAKAALSREVTANFHEPATLVEILGYLGQQAEVDIILDRQALGGAGMSDKSEISYAVDNRPLSGALNELLVPLKLGYRAIDAHTLQVTTQPALDARLELEFYPVGKILGKDQSGSGLIEQIKSTVSPASWNKTDSSAAIYFDQPSATLIILQSPPVHEAIQAYLNMPMEKKR